MQLHTAHASTPSVGLWADGPSDPVEETRIASLVVQSSEHETGGGRRLPFSLGSTGEALHTLSCSKQRLQDACAMHHTSGLDLDLHYLYSTCPNCKTLEEH